MLEEILKTRIMVKQSMKAYKHDKALSRLLHARQLGLKLIANVTFGYTAANFSGRMPCVEVRKLGGLWPVSHGNEPPCAAMLNPAQQNVPANCPVSFN